MKTPASLIRIALALCFVQTGLVRCQSFESDVLVDLPGKNYDVEVHSPDYGFPPGTYISWINLKDGIFSVYLKMISPQIKEDIIISSGTTEKSNPKLAYLPDESGMRVVWQEDDDGYHRIVGRMFIDDSPGELFILRDSLFADPQISMNATRIAWIEHGDLILKQLHPFPAEPEIIDTAMCSSPDIRKFDSSGYTTIIYEKGEQGARSIYHAEYREFPEPEWIYTILSDGDNGNPVHGVFDGLSFEKTHDSIRRIVYSAYDRYNFYHSTNNECSYFNPVVFSYDVPVAKFEEETPFFVAFDTDSLGDNHEVFINPFYFDLPGYDTLVRLSDIEGHHVKPKIAYILKNDELYVSVIWQRVFGPDIDIRIAVTKFNPIWNSVGPVYPVPASFNLEQNFPNPFNPTTTIRFTIPERSHISLAVYDLPGRRIATLIDGLMEPGDHSSLFDASSLAGGVYFYRLRTNDRALTRRFVLLK